MKITVYYVIRVYKDGLARIDSGPHSTYLEASDQRVANHYYNGEDYNIFESFIEGEIV